MEENITSQKYHEKEMEVIQNVLDENSSREQILNKAYRDLYENLDMISEDDLEMTTLNSRIDTDLIEECAETIVYLEGLMADCKDIDIEKMKEEGIKYYSQKVKEIDKRKHIRSFMAAAVIMFIALTFSTTIVAKGFGFNIFKGIVEWGKERFNMVIKNESNELTDIYNGIYLEFDSVEDAINKTGAIILYPKFLPDGYKLNMVTVEGSDSLVIYNLCYGDSESNLFLVIMDYEVENNANIVVEKDDSDPIAYIFNGVTHYIMENTNGINAFWQINNQVYNIYGEITHSDMNTMINSMYEE